MTVQWTALEEGERGEEKNSKREGDIKERERIRGDIMGYNPFLLRD